MTVRPNGQGPIRRWHSGGSRNRRCLRGALRLLRLCRLADRRPDPADRLLDRGIGRCTYKTALTLPFIGGSAANPVVKAFATTTMQQHSQHLSAFNASIAGLGGKAQTNPARLGKVVQAAYPGSLRPDRWWRWPSNWNREPRRPMWQTSQPSPTPTPKRSPHRSWGSKHSMRRFFWPCRRCSAGNAPQLIALPPNVTRYRLRPVPSASPIRSPTKHVRPATEGALS